MDSENIDIYFVKFLKLLKLIGKTSLLYIKYLVGFEGSMLFHLSLKLYCHMIIFEKCIKSSKSVLFLKDFHTLRLMWNLEIKIELQVLSGS